MSSFGIFTSRFKKQLKTNIIIKTRFFYVINCRENFRAKKH